MTTKDNMLRACRLTLIAVAGLLTACSSDDDATEKQPLLLTVEVAEQPLTTDEPAMTRTAITEIGDLKAFTLYGRGQSYNFSYNNGAWAVSGGTSNWPTTDKDEAVAFYAHTNNGITYDGQSYVSFKQNESAFDQYDLLGAYASTAYNNNNGRVRLAFDHVCAAVTFNLYMSNTLKQYLGDSKLYINSVKLCNVYAKGKYQFETKSWYDIGGTNDNKVVTDYTLTHSNLLEVSTTPLELPERHSDDEKTNYLFMIPQTLGASIEVKYKVGEGEARTKTYPLSGSWAAGKSYIINIKLTKSDLFPNQ